MPINVRKANKMRKVLNEKSIYDVKILSRDDLVSVLNVIKNTPDYSIAILTDSKGQIRMVLDIPNNFFNMQEEQLKGYFKNLARMSGASRVFFGTNDNETYKTFPGETELCHNVSRKRVHQHVARYHACGVG